MRRSFCALLMVVALGFAPAVQAQSLSQQLNQLFGPSGITLLAQGALPHTAHFSGASQAQLGSLVQTLATGAGDFTAVSTTPGFTYTYNPDLKLFERSLRNLGPVFLERAETVGKGHFDIGVSYLYVDFTELDGDELDDLSFTLRHGEFLNFGENPPNDPTNPAFEGDTIQVQFNKFKLRSHVIPVFATYGITDRWDVNLVVPVVHTELDARATATINVFEPDPQNPRQDPNVHQFPDGTQSLNAQAEDTSTGVGDILLRTKYRFTESAGFNLAGILGMRFPTGDEDDFQGIGDYTIAPSFIVSRLVTIPGLGDLAGPHDFHLNAGIDIDVESVSKSRARYGAGVTWRILERLAIITDVIGSSGIDDTEINTSFTEVTTQFDQSGLPVETPIQREVSDEVRTDLVDIHVGLKGNIYAGLVASVGAIVPLNDDGLRTDLTPALTIEYDF